MIMVVRWMMIWKEKAVYYSKIISRIFIEMEDHHVTMCVPVYYEYVPITLKLVSKQQRTLCSRP
jgi:hypothetical protein